MEHRFYFPCPVCKLMLPVRVTKNQKPYCTCNDCGVQLFVRGKPGINKFAKLVGKSKLRGDSAALINAIDYFNLLKERLNEVQSRKPILGINADLELQERIIKKQLAKLRKNMEKEDSR